MGMLKDKMDRLFKPFTQLEYCCEPQSAMAQASALQLSKKLVDLWSSGRRNKCESDEGKGGLNIY